MPETSPEIQPTIINPDGKEYPVFYMWRTKQGEKTLSHRVRIISSGDGVFDYMAINPTTEKEVKLKDVQWTQIYYSLLNKQPPEDLKKKVRLYYKIKEKKEKEKARKENLQYAPFDDPELIAA